MRGRGKGKGKYMGRSQPQPGACSGRKTLRTCRNKKEKDNVVVIDVDGDNFRNVILIDIPESLPKKIHGPDSRVPRKDKRFPLRTVIYIDDDENTEEDCIGTGTNDKENFAGASSSMRCTTSYQDSVDPVGDECQFVQENISPVKLSKCKRTYSGKVYTTNRYGLTSGIESDSSDDDFDDEFMESSFEQWQKAAMKRKNEVRNGHQDIGGGNKTYKSQKETLFEDLPEHREKSSLKTKNNVCKEDHASTSKIFYDDIRQETERKSKASSSSLGKGYQFDHQEQCSPQNTPSGPILEEQSTEHVNHADIFFKDKQENPQPNEEASFRNTQSYDELVGEIPKEFLFCKSSLGKSEVEGEKDLHQEQEEPSLCKVSANESQVKQGSSLDNGEDSADKHLHAQEGIENSLINEREKLKQTDEYKRAVEEEWASRQKELQIQAEEAQHLRRMRKRREGDEPTDCVENSLINKREKLKETDEYKRAAEEEWASRQRELQIQAEEAQHLRRMRKRRKAETMRLLDMEKRQKQRVEEIRETQKKDEENMNLKEELRAEVRKELQKLEVTCTDLASLLRGLGIVVNGGLNPQSQEVRVAYKKALLNFHPDRASQSDVRQQVEAEEKFKLISRMKDKFLPTL